MMNKNTTTLAIIAVLVVLAGVSAVSVAQEARVSEYAVSIDADQDGLSNDEEVLYGTDPNIRDSDGDGYSDGVEIKSGYNPLVPAPGDRLGIVERTQIAQSQHSGVNLTNEFVTVVAGMTEEAFQTGEDELSLDEIQAEASAIMGSSTSFDDLKEVDVSQIRIKKQDYADLSKDERAARVRQDIVDYTTAVSYIMSIYSPIPVNTKSPESMEKFMATMMVQVTQFSQDFSNASFFTDMADNGDKMLTEMNDIAVPEVMIPMHIRGVQLAQYASEIGTGFTVKEGDPMAMIAEMARLQALVMMTSEFYDEIEAELEKYDIVNAS